MPPAMIFVYVTCASRDEARNMADAIVGQRLAACANIMAGHDSVYWWEGKVQSAQEVAVVFKTRFDLFPALEAAIKEIHSYDVPCIVALPIETGHEPFLKWIEAETGTLN